jgi:DNA (cytosine-5)-methyltransferase 1
MGVPQKRERVFFIARRNDLNWSDLKLGFNEKPIISQFILNNSQRKMLAGKSIKLWEWCKKNNRRCFGEAHTAIYKKRSSFNHRYTTKNMPVDTITASSKLTHPDFCGYLNQEELCLAGSYPLDYKFKYDPTYLIGMSVPPLMTYKIANQIYLQWFKEQS